MVEILNKGGREDVTKKVTSEERPEMRGRRWHIWGGVTPQEGHQEELGGRGRGGHRRTRRRDDQGLLGCTPRSIRGSFEFNKTVLAAVGEEMAEDKDGSREIH